MADPRPTQRQEATAGSEDEMVCVRRCDLEAYMGIRSTLAEAGRARANILATLDAPSEATS